MSTTMLPLAAVQVPDDADFSFDSTLPLTEADLLAHPWSGTPDPLCRSSLVLAEAWPSEKNPGYVHYSCTALPSGFETYSKRACLPKVVGFAIDLILKGHGLCAADLKWSRMRHQPPRDGGLPLDAVVPREFVYFVGAGAFVKIGKTTGTPDSRIASLQTGCPYPMVLLAHQPGGIKEEFALHRRFFEYRARGDGEWFRYEGALRQYIESLAPGAAA